MTGFEEVSPLEGMWAPLQVRLELRPMFERWLTRRIHQRRYAADEMLDELRLLDMCQYFRLEYLGSAENVEKSWDESEQRIADGGPTFDELVRLGWVHCDGGRWSMPSTYLGAASYINYPSPSTKNFLTGLSQLRLVAKTVTQPPDAKALAAKIQAQDWLERGIPTREPDWLACRLWERLCPKPQHPSLDGGVIAVKVQSDIVDYVGDSSTGLDVEAGAADRAFLEWVAWCSALHVACRWDPDWGTAEQRYCREAALRALERQAIWGNWDRDVECYADVLEKTFGIPQEHLRYGSRPGRTPPRTLVSRAEWLTWPDVEHLMMERLQASTVSFAFRLLCSELEETDIGPSIMSSAEKVLSFAVDHPMALQQLMFRVDAVPGLLVDMLMHQRTACLAAKLAIKWRPRSVRDTDRNVSREAQTKAFVVQDSLSLIAYHLDKGALDIEECASLITWCYDGDAGSERSIVDSRRPIGRLLLGLVARESGELQSTVLQYLVEQAAYTDNISRARFAGVLYGLNCLPKVTIAHAFPIVALYSKFARDLQLDCTDAFNLSAELAARLVAVALAQAPCDREALLNPFDIAKLLREKPSDSYSIAQTLRGHVRLLARAVASWPDGGVPKELGDALQELVLRSVIEHAEKGRIGALTDRYGSGRFFTREKGSPAQDIALAWRKLDGVRQEAMLQAFANSDDPVLLAELCQNLPASAKHGLQARLRSLKPGEASTFWTWPELQHRIRSLLDAGEYGLAREHMDEAYIDLSRAPPEFQLGLFSLGLQLLLKEKNWPALDGVVVPSALDGPTMRQAQEQLDFYRATSQMLRPNGNLPAARVVLQRLAARPGAASAYKENAFAVALQQLLGQTLQPLTGADKAAGEGMLGEINAAVAVDDSQVSTSLLVNRALLLLALQRAKDALDSVALRRREERSPDLERIAVLAKHEMGQRVDAMAILDAAISEFNANELLIALKSELEANVATSSVALAAVTINTISSIRVALQQLTELLPSQIGDILGPAGCGVRGYLVREVSRAVATLQHMAAMLRDRKNAEDEARFEDDLNTAVREVLGARLAVTKWDVADQSLGGATANGNPGERDAVIRVSGQELSVYEALVCTNVDRTNIKKHFDKLLSYGIYDIYFHVIYAYVKELGPILGYVKKMLEHEVPSGFTYLGCEVLSPSDYETSGYVATYRADHREVAVVFLVADLKVSVPQVTDAAALAIAD